MDEVCFRSFRADWLNGEKSPKTVDLHLGSPPDL